MDSIIGTNDMSSDLDYLLSHEDTNIELLTRQEFDMQNSKLKMIASENYASSDVLRSVSSIFSDRYAEGFIGHRFYGACTFVDEIEKLTANTATELFEAKHAFVQPNSGSEANLIAFRAILHCKVIVPFLKEKGIKNINGLSREEFNELRHKLIDQKILAMDLSCGGHLTHGYKLNISAMMFDAYHYGLDENEMINYDEIREKALALKPLIIIAGASAYPHRIDFEKIKQIAIESGSVFMADFAHISGFVAAKIFTDEFNPVKHADIATSTTHKTLRGPRGGLILTNNDELFASVNKACPLCIGGPHINGMIAKYMAFKEASLPEFKTYSEGVLINAKALNHHLNNKGVKTAFNGTSTHMIIIDLKDTDITGRELEEKLCELGVITNRNSVPNDPRSPLVTSGVRIGLAALTTRGLVESDMIIIAEIISTIINNFSDIKRHSEYIKDLVKDLTDRYPLKAVYNEEFIDE